MLTAESEEELKSLLMKVKEESVKAGLVLVTICTLLHRRFLEHFHVQLRNET